ncbi:MAG: hypothetical protein ACAI44_40800 [Candidatus Sericytochromatia bacterium]
MIQQNQMIRPLTNAANPLADLVHSLENSLRDECAFIREFSLGIPQLTSGQLARSLEVFRVNRGKYYRMLLALMRQELDITCYEKLLEELDALIQGYATLVGQS